MRGDVVIVDFPYGDVGASKVRPALVVQGDGLVSLNVIVALISSQVHRVGPSRLLIDPAKPEGQGSGLRVPSVVMCENLYSPNGKRILRTIGRVPDATMSRIDDCLKAALDLT